MSSIAIAKIHPDPDNVRDKVDADATAFKELTASIAALGVLEPLLLRSHPDKAGEYLVTAGHRRLAAAKKAKLVEVPAHVREMSAQEVVESQLIENLQRADLNPVEEARAYFRLVEIGMTPSTLAKRIGRPQRHVTDRIKFLELPANVLAAIAAGDLTVADAGSLAKYSTNRELLDRVLKERKSANNRHVDTPRLAASVERTMAGEAEIAKVKAAAKEHGWTIVEQSGYYLPDECKTWARLRSTYDSHLFKTDAEATKHANESCHAVAWRNRHGDIGVEFYCSQPGRHGPKGESEMKSTSAKQPNKSGGTKASPERRALLAARREATAHRQAFLRTLCSGKISPAARTSMIALAVRAATAIHVGWYSDDKTMRMSRVFLGDDLPERKKGEQYPHSWGSSVLDKMAGDDSLDVRLRAFMAKWCGAIEMQAGGPISDQGKCDERTIAWYRFLVSEGYVLHPWEHSIIGRKMTPPKPRKKAPAKKAAAKKAPAKR